MKNIICIVGKTGRGKDTLAKRIRKELGIPSVCSFTTRPIRDGETNGVEHYFVSEDDMDNIVKSKEMIAFTEIAGYRYCAIVEDLLYDEIIYIIDPKGLKYLKDNFSHKYSIFTVELWADDSVIDERIKLRGDNWDTYLERCEREREDFDTFHNSKDYDISIPADSDIDKVFSDFYRFYMREYNI